MPNLKHAVELHDMEAFGSMPSPGRIGITHAPSMPSSGARPPSGEMRVPGMRSKKDNVKAGGQGSGKHPGVGGYVPKSKQPHKFWKPEATTQKNPKCAFCGKIERHPNHKM